MAKKNKEVQKKTKTLFRKSNPCPFECKKCLTAFVFDYELIRHNENEPDCDTTTIYHKLREEAIAKEKEDQMNEAQRKVAIDFNNKVKRLEKEEKTKERREIRLEREHTLKMQQLKELEEI